LLTPKCAIQQRGAFLPDRIHRVTDDKIKELIDEFAAEPDRNKQLAIFDRLREILIKRRKDEKSHSGE
jgi:hypothetical protein